MGIFYCLHQNGNIFLHVYPNFRLAFLVNILATFFNSTNWSQIQLNTSSEKLPCQFNQIFYIESRTLMLGFIFSLPKEKTRGKRCPSILPYLILVNQLVSNWRAANKSASNVEGVLVEQWILKGLFPTVQDRRLGTELF